MTALLAFLRVAWPYLLAAALGAAAGAYGASLVADRVLAAEKLTHASDVATLHAQIDADTAAAAAADAKALADHRAQEGRIATLDDQLTKEQQAHEADNRTYAAALAAGTQRLRVRVTACTARSNDVPTAASTPGVDDGGATYADLDPATASRVFGVAGDDQREIDKLKGLQGWACAVRPDLPACAH